MMLEIAHVRGLKIRMGCQDSYVWIQTFMKH